MSEKYRPSVWHLVDGVVALIVIWALIILYNRGWLFLLLFLAIGWGLLTEVVERLWVGLEPSWAGLQARALVFAGLLGVLGLELVVLSPWRKAEQPMSRVEADYRWLPQRASHFVCWANREDNVLVIVLADPAKLQPTTRIHARQRYTAFPVQEGAWVMVPGSRDELIVVSPEGSKHKFALRPGAAKAFHDEAKEQFLERVQPYLLDDQQEAYGVWLHESRREAR